eukprot:m.191565 g.191565  ORF g.191565 m.191565 type:complete len:777 (-) comp10048_c3_seq1:146-2476(-)
MLLREHAQRAHRRAANAVARNVQRGQGLVSKKPLEEQLGALVLQAVLAQIQRRQRGMVSRGSRDRLCTGRADLIVAEIQRHQRCVEVHKLGNRTRALVADGVVGQAEVLQRLVLQQPRHQNARFRVVQQAAVNRQRLQVAEVPQRGAQREGIRAGHAEERPLEVHAAVPHDVDQAQAAQRGQLRQDLAEVDVVDQGIRVFCDVIDLVRLGDGRGRSVLGDLRGTIDGGQQLAQLQLLDQRPAQRQQIVQLGDAALAGDKLFNDLAHVPLEKHALPRALARRRCLEGELCRETLLPVAVVLKQPGGDGQRQAHSQLIDGSLLVPLRQLVEDRAGTEVADDRHQADVDQRRDRRDVPLRVLSQDAAHPARVQHGVLLGRRRGERHTEALSVRHSNEVEIPDRVFFVLPVDGKELMARRSLHLGCRGLAVLAVLGVAGMCVWLLGLPGGHMRAELTCPPATLQRTEQCEYGFIPSVAGPAACVPCPHGQYAIPGDTTCHNVVGCAEMTSVADRKRLTAGGVKTIYKANWRGLPVALSVGHEHVREDVLAGMHVLRHLAPHARMVTPLGICEDRLEIMTPYYKNGGGHHISAADYTWADRVQFAKDLVASIAYIHTSPIGSRVMCDGNSIRKLLSQFLITDSKRLVLNDVDALPQANRSAGLLIKCGHREIVGDAHDPENYIPPEQLWMHADRPFSDAEMPPYCEKTDIWKLFFAVRAILDGPPAWCARALSDRLGVIRDRSLVEDAAARPCLATLGPDYAALFAEIGPENVAQDTLALV